jgi:hypothetical protein
VAAGVGEALGVGVAVGAAAVAPVFGMIPTPAGAGVAVGVGETVGTQAALARATRVKIATHAPKVGL